jgi:phage baseplate assembly protein W
MRSDPLGTSLAFPLRLDGRGGLALSSGVASVEDSLRAIILSPKGSHQLEPWLGLPLFVFQPMPSTRAAAEAVKAALIAGEDRVDPDFLEVEVAIGDEGIAAVTVVYQVKDDATERTLALGFRELLTAVTT